MAAEDEERVIPFGFVKMLHQHLSHVGEEDVELMNYYVFTMKEFARHDLIIICFSRTN